MRRVAARARAPSAGLAVVAAAGLAGCGAEPTGPATLPAAAADYRSAPEDARTGLARDCRDATARRSEGLAARQITAVDPRILRIELDLLTSPPGARPFRSACAAAVPRVTPGLDVRFAGATGNGRAFAYTTRSDRPLTIRGTVSPAPRAGRVLANRVAGEPDPPPAAIDAEGRFAFRDIKLRKLADNSFVLRIEAPPNAPRIADFSALCLDCAPGAAEPGA